PDPQTLESGRHSSATPPGATRAAAVREDRRGAGGSNALAPQARAGRHLRGRAGGVMRERSLMSSPPRRTLSVLAACAGGIAAAVLACTRPVAPVVAPPEPAAPGLFEDVTAGSGLGFTYRNGEEASHYAILESLGGGVGLIDYDRDGFLDIFVTGRGSFA